VCVKDCGLHNQNIDMIILFACLVARLNSSPVEIKKNEGKIFKNLLGLARGVNTVMAPCIALVSTHPIARLSYQFSKHLI
jgi:hypothetical protein